MVPSFKSVKGAARARCLLDSTAQENGQWQQPELLLRCWRSAHSAMTRRCTTHSRHRGRCAAEVLQTQDAAVRC